MNIDCFADFVFWAFALLHETDSDGNDYVPLVLS